MDNLASLVGMQGRGQGARAAVHRRPDVPTALVGDPARLGQVLVNLGNNAVKFTREGEVVVGVEKCGDAERASSCTSGCATPASA
jgi:signal transduction histidine kinase